MNALLEVRSVTVRTNWWADALIVALPGAALQRLGLIQDHVLPLDPLEILDVLHHQLVARDHHVERRVLGVERFLWTHTRTRGEWTLAAG